MLPDGIFLKLSDTVDTMLYIEDGPRACWDIKAEYCVANGNPIHTLGNI